MAISINIQLSDEDLDLLDQDQVILARRQQGMRDGLPVFEVRVGRKRHGRPLHRLVMKRMVGGKRIPRNIIVDHINRDPLDNRRENLRLATARQNAANRTRVVRENSTSRYNGVHRVGKRWRAQGSIPDGDGGYKRASLGMFDTEKEAALAYNEFAIREYGEYAHLNVVE